MEGIKYLIDIFARFQNASEVKKDLRDVQQGIKDFGTFSQKSAQDIEKTTKAIGDSLGGMGKTPVDTKRIQQFDAIRESMEKLGFSSEKTDHVLSQFYTSTKNIAIPTNQIDKLNASLKASGASSQQINSINKNLKEMGIIAPKTSSGVNDLTKALRRAAIVAPVWMALRTAMQAVLNLVKDQVKFLIDLESAMARIKIVGKGTEEEFTNLKNSLVALSFAYGTASSKALDAAVIFAQQGKSVSETIALTQQAMLASIVLGKDIKTVTEDMTAAMNSYGISSRNSLSIIDKWIGVEKEFAVTSRDLADATKVTGATAKQVGVTIDELLGDVTAVIEVTRKSGSEAARGLQFIYARLLTSAKPLIQSLTGIKFYLDSNNEATNSLTGTLRSATDILDDLSTKWSSLTNEQQLQIAASVGSKRQMNTLNALMINHNRAIDARIKSLTSAGQAERAFNIEQETTKFKAEQLSAAWNNFTNALGDTGAFKTVLDAMSQLILGYTALVDVEKGYLAVTAKETLQQSLANKKIIEQTDNYEELVKARDKFSKASATDENLKRIDALNSSINDFLSKNKELKLAVEIGDKEKINTEIEKIRENALRQDIILNVKPQFLGKVSKLEEELATIVPPTIFGKELSFIGLPKKAKELRKEITDLMVAYNDEVEKQLKKSKEESIIQKSLGEDTAFLTDEEEKRLDVERQLSNNQILYSDNLEKQVQKQIELVKADNLQYNDKQKLLKLEELNNKLIDARLQQRKKEADSVKDLILRYEEADTIERKRIRRQIELQTMSPTQVVNAYRGSQRDQDIILKNLSAFSEEVRNAIANLINVKYNITNQPLVPTLRQSEKAFQSTVKLESNINITIPPTAPLLKDKEIRDLASQVGKQAEQETINQLKRVGSPLNKATREANDYGGEEQP